MHLNSKIMWSEIKRIIRKIQASYYINRFYFPFDKDWFKNKRVVIIGGADSALKEKNGDFIDQFDVVVRINKGVEIIEAQNEFVGARTDVLFHTFLDNPEVPGSSPITEDLWRKHKVSKIVYCLNYQIERKGIYDILTFMRKSKKRLKFSQVPKEIHKKNIESIKPYWPTTGHIAINTIMNCEPKELYITGITFFKTPHNKAYRDQKIETFQKAFTGKPGSHNPDAEYQYFKKIYDSNQEIIKPDKVLKKILDTNL